MLYGKAISVLLTRNSYHLQTKSRVTVLSYSGIILSTDEALLKHESRPMLDFDAAWKDLQLTRKRPACSAHWNKRAARYDSKDAKNLYALEFIEKSQFTGNETILDMGCGTGALAVPLAKAGHSIIAADFSEGMLDKLRENMDIHQITSIKPILMSWEDDWEAHGITDNCVDVVIASRSIAVDDLQSALAKICRIAKKRCCITMATETTPRVDPAILKAINVPINPSRDFIYAFGMLAQHGFEPQVSYIHSQRKDTFDSHEEILEDFTAMIEVGSPSLSPEEFTAARERLSDWISQHTIANPQAGQPDKKGYPQGALTLDHNRIISWAFITWDSKKGAF